MNDLFRLTNRQFELLEHKCRTGESKKQVAEHFGLSYYTVHTHFRETLIRLRVHSIDQACLLMGQHKEATRWMD